MADSRPDRTSRPSSPPPAETDAARAESHARSVLEARGVILHDDDSPDGLAHVLSGVERFEEAVARRGGDSFTNSPLSADPDRAEFVLPRRAADESADRYASRLTRLAGELSPGAP